MSSSENIRKAFEIVVKTYENVDKLMKYCDVASEDLGYIALHQRFLRYKSDVEPLGWLTSEFIKVYQHKEGRALDNSFYDGPVYVMEINFDDGPFIYVSKLEYEDISTWDAKLRPGDYWGFSNPICEDNENFKVGKLEDEGNLFESVPKNQAVKDEYWGFERAVFIKHDLTVVRRGNIQDIIFDTFDKLRSL